MKNVIIFQDHTLITCNPVLLQESNELSMKTGSQIITDPALIPHESPVIMFSEKGVSLVCSGLEMKGDFEKNIPRLRRNNLNRELLIKAARIKNYDKCTAIDATAGMGEDSLLLAAAGFDVIMYENDPFIAALLRDSMRRAHAVPELTEVMNRMTLIESDSISALNCLDHRQNNVDVIYLDPMFPERMKSGLVKKKFQLLHFLENPCCNEKELLEAAMKAHPFKIVIKRPIKEKTFSGIKPSYSIYGKTIRYDCIVL